MDRTWSVDCLVSVPRILIKLLVTERKTTVFLVDVENYNVDRCTYLSEL